MDTLDRALRNKLERTIRVARDIAEEAARAVLEQLGVGEAEAFSYLNEEERKLRRKLRTHGRQLGDLREGDSKVQRIDRLIDEVAYEHWHRMLFARFLAENGLLMYPVQEDVVPVTLEECGELASEEGTSNGWELAARFASRMLPQIFRHDSPVFQLTFSPEHQQKLERLVEDIPVEAFTASDSLGWAYQFWQAKRKKEVKKRMEPGDKVGALELPPVTQLFTEPYMVDFLLDNSLGAWWSMRRLSDQDLKNAKSEEELRAKAAIPGVPLKYLRFIRQEGGDWTPASGKFDRWPECLSELKALDPCCGSGHFLVAVFLMLVPIRMEMEGLSAKDSVDRVLEQNIHGLELDQRCVELAAFALAMTAWRYPNSGGYRALPDLNLACSGLSVSVAKDEWKRLGLGRHNLTIALEWIHDTFRDAPTLGSLLNPAQTDAAKLVRWEELSATMESALSQDRDDERQEVAVVAQGLAKAATLLAGRYKWIVTNVPYLTRANQGDVLRDFCEKNYSAAKNDLATVFLDRCMELCSEGGTASIVLPQNWLFLVNYSKFREKLLKSCVWHTVARLGEGGFDSPAADGAFVALIIISAGKPVARAGDLFHDDQDVRWIRGLDVSQSRTAVEKSERLIKADIKSVEQEKQLDNPDARVVWGISCESESMSDFSFALNGMHGADSARLRFHFWEIGSSADWIFLQNTVKKTSHFSGRSQIFYWPDNGFVHKNNPNARIQGEPAWGKHGVSVSMMRELECTLYFGEAFDISSSPVIPHNPENLPAIWCFCSSPEYSESVRRIDQKLNVTNATLVKVPFDLERWTKVAEEKYPNGLPRPYTDDPTQWIFHGHPCGSVIWDEDEKRTSLGPIRVEDTVLQVAVARLLGYRWPAELDLEMELALEQRELVSRCDVLLDYADDDGIVCIPSVRGEDSASDRLLNLLAAAYGDNWSNDTLPLLLNAVEHGGKSLETWLRDKFFVQHCKLFNHRPFVWHIWDGLRDGFAALVNYHKLDYKMLETLIYTYLGDWISRQKQDIGRAVDGAQERLAAAESLQRSLELILEGEAPYDIFVRWKSLKEQPIGWNPDLNDGVRINIRPFLSVPDVGKKGAGCLKDKPNVNWNKDRGKDSESAPWYHLGPIYGGKEGDRINDHHLSLAEKRSAREE